MSLNKLFIEDGSSVRFEDGETLILESSEVVNVIEAWRGAVEPAKSGGGGNEIQLWRGAVEPAGPAAFAGAVASDGGTMWMPRAGDPRWTQLITDSGITTTGNFIDDVHTALETLAGTTGQMDVLWHKVLALYSVTDTSEPFSY